MGGWKTVHLWKSAFHVFNNFPFLFPSALIVMLQVVSPQNKTFKNSAQKFEKHYKFIVSDRWLILVSFSLTQSWQCQVRKEEDMKFSGKNLVTISSSNLSVSLDFHFFFAGKASMEEWRAEKFINAIRNWFQADFFSAPVDPMFHNFDFQWSRDIGRSVDSINFRRHTVNFPRKEKVEEKRREHNLFIYWSLLLRRDNMYEDFMTATFCK